MQVFQMMGPNQSVSEAWIGNSADEIKEKMKEKYGWSDAETNDNIEAPIQLSESALHKLSFTEDDGKKGSLFDHYQKELAKDDKSPRFLANLGH